jgi:CheY-like chemotaxis protein
MDQRQFRRDVKDALNHLYDQAYLETALLLDTLGIKRPGAARGPLLQQTLLDAIQALRPSADLPYSSLAWRRYRYLYLRYAQAAALVDIGNDLGISLRQARRYSLDGLTAVTAYLWDRYCAGKVTPETTGEDAGESPELAAVDEEVVHVEAQARETEVAVGELLVGVVRTIRPLADRRGVPVAVTIAEGIPLAIADRAVLRQILLNVLTLALEVGSAALGLTVESIAAETVRIRIRSSFAVDPKVVAEQMVADERWYIARHLLQAQHGSAAIDADGDKTLAISLFVRSFPAAKVLVIEDNLDVINLYRRYLSDSPFQLVVPAVGSDPVDAAVVEQPAAIILDVMMPTQDGWEILQLLKGRSETRDIPVIVCSILKERELALALSAEGLLVKPVSRAALLQALDNYHPSRSLITAPAR